MSADAIDVRNRIVSQSKQNLLENAGILGATLAILITAFSLMFSGIAFYAAYDAAEESEITSMYVVELHACLTSEKCTTIPPIPKELLK